MLNVPPSKWWLCRSRFRKATMLFHDDLKILDSLWPYVNLTNRGWIENEKGGNNKYGMLALAGALRERLFSGNKSPPSKILNRTWHSTVYNDPVDTASKKKLLYSTL